MHDERVIVLKFGGSVLVDADAVPRAVHEIYRWHRAGWRVVAVASALAGTTEALFADARADAADPFAVCARVATGESESAAMLAAALDRAGVPTRCLDDRIVRARVDRDPVNATPIAVDTATLARTLAAVPVAIVPGYVARDAADRIVLLGRGGSDLTAVFVADALDARCRLLKDVDGVYEWDPRRPGPAPRRFATLAFTDARSIDDAIVQRRAVRFAARAGRVVEIAAPFRSDATRLGAAETAFAAAPAASVPCRVVVLGAGTVGGGVVDALARLGDRFEVVAVGARSAGWRDGRLVTDAASALAVPCDVVVECIGGVEPARSWIAHALAAGRDVVTANKAVIAVHGQALAALAARVGRSLRFSASIGGCVPVLETARRLGDVDRVDAILNGTTNFVLDRVSAGTPIADALAAAIARGFAEGDGRRDLDGSDAADKAALLVRALTGEPFDVDAVERMPVDPDGFVRATRPGVLRQCVAIDARDRPIRVRVALRRLDADDPLAGVEGERNAVVFRRADGTTERLDGRGAGRWPTTEAVIGDLLDIVAGPVDVPRGSAVAGVA